MPSSTITEGGRAKEAANGRRRSISLPSREIDPPFAEEVQ